MNDDQTTTFDISQADFGELGNVGGFGALPLDCIQTVPADTYVARDGEIVLNFNAYEFARLVNVAGCAAGTEATGFCHVELAPRSCQLTTYDHNCFFRGEIATTQDSQNIDQPRRFAIRFLSLAGAALAVRTFVRLIYIEADAELRIDSDNFTRTIRVERRDRFLDFEITEKPTNRSDVDIKQLERALRFVLAFTNSKSTEEYAEVHYTGDSLMAGAPFVAAAGALAPFADSPISFRLEPAKGLYQSLAFFASSTVSSFRWSGLFFLQSMSGLFGIRFLDRTKSRALADSFVPKEYVIIPRTELAHVVNQLSAIDPFGATIRVRTTTAPTLEFSAVNKAGESTVTLLDARNADVLPVGEWRLAAGPLQTAIKLCQSAGVQINASDELFWIDVDDVNLLRVYIKQIPKPNSVKRRVPRQATGHRRPD